MSDVKRSIKITLDHSDMVSKYAELDKKTEVLNSRLAALNEAGKGNTKEAENLQKALNNTSKAMDSECKKIEQTEKVLNNLSGATYKELMDVKKQLIKELQKEERGTEAYAAKCEQLTKVQAELKTAQSAMTSTMGETGSATTRLMAQFAAAPGIIGMMTMSVQGLIVACKAFIANPIGLILAAIGATVALCVKAFKDFGSASEDGAMKSAKSLAPIKVLTTELGKAVKWLGGLITDMIGGLTSGIYKMLGWLAQYSDWAKEVYDNMTRQYEIEEDSYKLGKERNALIEREAEIEAELSKLKMQASQKDKYTAQERLAMVEEYIAKENELSKLKADMARQEYELWEKESAQDDNDYEANKKGAELKKAMYDAERQHNEKLQAITKRRLSLQDELNGASSTGVDLAKQELDVKVTTSDIIDNQVQSREELFSRLQQLQDEYDLNNLEAEEKKVADIAMKYDALQQEFNDALAKKLISEEEYEQKSSQLQLLHAQENAALLEEQRKEVEAKLKLESDQMEANAQQVRMQLQGENLDAQFEAELEHLQRLYDAKLLSDKEYAQASMTVHLKKMEQRIQKEQALLNQAATISASLQDYSLAKTEARYRQELALAGDNTAKKAQIEEQYEQDKLDVQKRYADINFAIKAASIVADTAVSIMRGYAELGPIAGSVAAVMLGTVGALQLATANQERQAIKAMTLSSSASESETSQLVTGSVVLRDGYANGGNTGVGADDEPAGIVHRNEYVIPAWQMRMPETIEMVKILEATRLRGRGQRSGNSTDGYQAGGPVTEPSASGSDYNDRIIAALERLSQAIGLLLESMPLSAVVVLTELEKQQLRLAKSKALATKKND